MKTLKLLFLLLLPISAMADGGLATMEQLIGAPRVVNTECASRAFADAMAARAEHIDVNASEEQMKQFIYDVFQSPETLGSVISCPEIADADPDETIRFMPIRYTFSNGRQLVINYETQPRVLKQRFTLAAKRELPTDDPNPAINPLDETATWVNTDPAWYAIMVVQRGALDEFVGPDKNNTISMNYIHDNINKLYPSGAKCTNKTAIADDDFMINRVMGEKTVGDESQDYYVAGDRSLRWISYAEIAADVILSVASWGGFAVLSGVSKMARVMDAMRKLGTNMKALAKLPKVKEYIKIMGKVARANRNIQSAENIAQSLKTIEKLEDAVNAARGTEKYEQLVKELKIARDVHADNLAKFAKQSGNVADLKSADKIEDFIKQSKNEINTLENEMDAARRADPNVKMFQKHYDSLKDLAEYSNKLRKFKQARSGNLFARAKNIAKSVAASRSGAKKIDKAVKLARAGERSLTKTDNIFKIAKSLLKSGDGLGKLVKDATKYHNAARDIATGATYHLEEIGKLTAEQLAKLSKVDADELVKLIASEKDALATFSRSTTRLTDLEKASERATKLEKELSGLKRGTPEYEHIAEELRRVANNELVKKMSPAQAKEYRNIENKIAKLERMSKENPGGLSKDMKKELQKLNQDRGTLLNKVGRERGLTPAKQLDKELELARKAHLDDAAHLTKTVEAVTKSISRFGLKRANLKSVFRHSLSASSARDWLFHSTLRNASRVAHVGEDLVVLHFVLGLLGDFYDVTSASTDQYTNGISMKPLLLLSADDIPGQENVVNYGMWLMWQGAYSSQESDDAAYLEAMDFAQKFWEDMIETAVEDGKSECDVDIYVVRPIIRNPGTSHESLYWLIMNDKPWTVVGGAI